jgi:hypothetical protein
VLDLRNVVGPAAGVAVVGAVILGQALQGAVVLDLNGLRKKDPPHPGLVGLL